MMFKSLILIKIQIESSLHQIDFSIIDGNVEFAHSQYNLVFVSDKIINDSDNFKIKCLFYVFFIFLIYTILFNLGKHVNLCGKFRFPCYI